MTVEEDDKIQDSDFFYGFYRSDVFESLFHRLEYLEKWKELAIRPDSCDPEDADLLEADVDDLVKLQERCWAVRKAMNRALPPIETTEWEDSLVAKTSTIPNTGLGLFYEPGNGKTIAIPSDTTICYYTGHLHNFQSARHFLSKENQQGYLMAVQGTVLVDPGPVPTIQARYINDPMNEDVVNCRFVPDGNFRSAVVTTRTIEPGQELFVSYGDAYWSGKSIVPKAYQPSRYSR